MSIKINKVIKKLSSVALVFAMLFGLFTLCGNSITAKAAQSPVAFYSLDSRTIYHGISSYNVYIQIAAGSAGSKSVSITYPDYQGTTQEANASFYTKIDSETEIWKVTVSGPGLSTFNIKYVGDGKTYYDNNHSFSNPLGEANIKALCSSYPTSYNCQINAAVKNLAYTKTVKVRYTTDNWATWQEADLSYQYTISGTDTEVWHTSLNLGDSVDMDKFHYCLNYQVNNQGTIYWDNNFGANYDRSFYSPY